MSDTPNDPPKPNEPDPNQTGWGAPPNWQQQQPSWGAQPPAGSLPPPPPPPPPPGTPPPGGGWQPPPPPYGWQPYPGTGPQPPRSNAANIIFIILGVLESLCCCGLGTIGGVTAIVFASMSLSKQSTDAVGAAKFQRFAWIALLVGFVLSIFLEIVLLAVGHGTWYLGNTTSD